MTEGRIQRILYGIRVGSNSVIKGVFTYGEKKIKRREWPRNPYNIYVCYVISGEESCKTSNSNSKKGNPCMNHPWEPLVGSAQWEGFFLYLSNHIMWNEPNGGFYWFLNDQLRAHPKKRAKRDTMLFDGKKTSLNMNPSFTPSKINDGYGIGYNPAQSFEHHRKSQLTTHWTTTYIWTKIRNLLATSRVQFRWACKSGVTNLVLNASEV